MARDEPLRPGALGDDGEHLERRHAEQIAERIEARDDIGLPAHHPPAEEG